MAVLVYVNRNQLFDTLAPSRSHSQSTRPFNSKCLSEKAYILRPLPSFFNHFLEQTTSTYFGSSSHTSTAFIYFYIFNYTSYQYFFVNGHRQRSSKWTTAASPNVIRTSPLTRLRWMVATLLSGMPDTSILKSTSVFGTQTHAGYC